MQEHFANHDLAGARFRNVNLHRARFENVNLAEAVITDANLHNMVIEDANITGLTIFGLRIDHLIEAEWDRRDPERAALGIADTTDPAQVRVVMARLDERRDAFRTTLNAADPDRVVARPQPDQWSALEHVRHLLFVDDLYLNRWIRGVEQPFSPLGLRPSHMDGAAEFAHVGSEPTSGLAAVLAAWAEIHATLPSLLQTLTPVELQRISGNGAQTVGEVWQGLAHHSLQHMRAAEAALAA